jgi:hypothetical protein
MMGSGSVSFDRIAAEMEQGLLSFTWRACDL